MSEPVRTLKEKRPEFQTRYEKELIERNSIYIYIYIYRKNQEVSILTIKKRQSKANTSSLTPIERNSSIKPYTLKSSSCSFIFQTSV
jgi:hypothetical protein